MIRLRRGLIPPETQIDLHRQTQEGRTGCSQPFWPRARPGDSAACWSSPARATARGGRRRAEDDGAALAERGTARRGCWRSVMRSRRTAATARSTSCCVSRAHRAVTRHAGRVERDTPPEGMWVECPLPGHSMPTNSVSVFGNAAPSSPALETRPRKLPASLRNTKRGSPRSISAPVCMGIVTVRRLLFVPECEMAASLANLYKALRPS